MARKIALMRNGQPGPVLEEEAAPEADLQEALKLNPDLIPADELGVDGPLMVVGRETSVSSGAVDLLGLGRGGEVVVIELKTGPQNSDFRAATAQLLDYGAQLWGMSYEDFERSVALRFLGGARCPPDSPARGSTSLSDAARATWSGLDDEGLDLFQRGLAMQLEQGGFCYVLAAQRFTPTMERTLRYLNSQLLAARFYGVELIRFSGKDLDILEARTVLRPETRQGPSSRQSLDEGEFLGKVPDAAYRGTLKELFASCRGLGLKPEWGSSGVSIRFRLPDSGKPVSVAWVFPPGVSGWMGLSDLTAGYAPSKSDDPRVRAAFEAYVETVGGLPGASPIDRAGLKGVHIESEAAKAAYPALVDAIDVLLRALGGS